MYPYRGRRIYHVQELFVDAAHRGRGVGRALLDAAAAGRETVFTQFAHTGAPAMHFYRRMRFRRHRFYQFHYARFGPRREVR